METAEAVGGRPLRLGTRGSPLALVQAEETRRRLAAAVPALAAPGAIEIVTVKTSGDRIQDRPLYDLGGKGLFAKELEEALLDGRIDVAVHALKDLPTWLPDGLVLQATLPREDARDALVTLQGAETLDALPEGARLGTCSMRRQAQALMRRPDLEVVPLRGNVDTRLRKLAEGVCDATMLAVAGLSRLGIAEVGRPLSTAEMLPAVAQGAIGLEVRSRDEQVRAWLDSVNDAVTWRRIGAERACLAALRGSCTTPVAVLAEETSQGLGLRALLALPDGTLPLHEEASGDAGDFAAIGRQVGEALRGHATPEHLALLEA